MIELLSSESILNIRNLFGRWIVPLDPAAHKDNDTISIIIIIHIDNTYYSRTSLRHLTTYAIILEIEAMHCASQANNGGRV